MARNKKSKQQKNPNQQPAAAVASNKDSRKQKQAKKKAAKQAAAATNNSAAEPALEATMPKSLGGSTVSNEKQTVTILQCLEQCRGQQQQQETETTLQLIQQGIDCTLSQLFDTDLNSSHSSVSRMPSSA